MSRPPPAGGLLAGEVGARTRGRHTSPEFDTRSPPSCNSDRVDGDETPQSGRFFSGTGPAEEPGEEELKGNAGLRLSGRPLAAAPAIELMVVRRVVVVPERVHRVAPAVELDQGLTMQSLISPSPTYATKLTVPSSKR